MEEDRRRPGFRRQSSAEWVANEVSVRISSVQVQVGAGVKSARDLHHYGTESDTWPYFSVLLVVACIAVFVWELYVYRESSGEWFVDTEAFSLLFPDLLLAGFRGTHCSQCSCFLA